MVFAHIFGIPVEETALIFAPVMVVFIAGVRAHHAHRKVSARTRRGMRRTPSSEDPQRAQRLL